MKMSEVLTKLKGFLDDATSTHLADARTHKFDYPTTERNDRIPEIRLIPLSSEDEEMFIGSGGWYTNFELRIECRIPLRWENTDDQLELCEEIHQIIANNNYFLNDGGEQATLSSKTWSYGFESEGEAGRRIIDMTIVYQAPQVLPA